MKISDKGLDLIKRFEGLRLKAYLCPANVWTIGYGHTGSDVKKGMEITKERAEELLRRDVARFETGVSNVAATFTQGQFDALVSFAFNLGLGALMSSTLLRKHKAGDYEGAANEFRKWVYARGQKLPGLVTRRVAEAELYRS